MGNNKKPPLKLDDFPNGPPSKAEQKRIADQMNKRGAAWAKKRMSL